MKTQEMFEKLGFKYYKLSTGFGYKTNTWYADDCLIYFDETIRIYYVKELHITPLLHKAIHQQMKELGWLDE